MLFAAVGIPLYILSNGAKYSNFSISSPTLVIFYLFVCLIVAIPIGMREYLTVVLTCISSMISNAKHHFICLWPFVYVLWRKVYSSPFLFLIRFFLFLLLGCRSSLYILDIDPFSGIKFSIIFSHSLSCLFPLFMVSFDKQKFLSLVQSRWSVLAFVTCDFSVISKR